MPEKPPNLPYPIIYGPDFPKIRFQTKDGKQKIFSSTNKNLFLESYDFTESGTFTMGQFLIRSGVWNSDNCRSCKKFCPLFITKMSYDKETNFAQIRQLVKDTPKWETCLVIKSLLQCMQSEAEKRWFLGYLNATHTWWKNHHLPEKIAQKWNEYSLSEDVSDDKVKLSPEFEEEIKSNHASNLIKKAFSVPAPIPQVWLNYIPPWEIKPGSSLDRHLQKNPSRVDFLIISRASLIIVEIDGPSHFGVFDEKLHKWVIDERRYSRNLWIERSLRKQGYQLHRFSSWEIMRCTSDFDQYLLARRADKETFLFSSLIGELHLDNSEIEINDEFIQSYPGLNPADL